MLAPLQAFILKICLEKKIGDLRELSSETVTGLLVEAMVEILSQCGREVLVLARVTRDVAQILQDSEDHSNNSKRMRHASSALVDIDTFHTFLMVESFSSVKNLQSYLEENFNEIFGTKYDIVSFLYSVVLTKGPDSVITERQDMEESLIGELPCCSPAPQDPHLTNSIITDPVHGHGSQSLINLLVTGTATQNVFDGNKDLCGLQLKGIASQSSVGFLSYLECLRYLEVGKNLKSPVWPVWVVGSETHLTVLFSRNLQLVSPPSQRDLAREQFTSLDQDNAGFISSDKLQQLMQR